MYEYENGVKKKNVGYARIEARNGECKFTIHMQMPGLMDGIFPTYLIQRKNGDLDLIYLGDSVLKNQVMDSKLYTNEKNIMETGYGISDIGGILLFLNSEIFYATEWDDKPVVLTEVLEALKPKEHRAKTVAAIHPAREPDENTEEPANNEQQHTQAAPIQPRPERPGITQPELSMPDTAPQQPGTEQPQITPVRPGTGTEQTQTTPVQPGTEQPDSAVPLYKLPRGWKTVERLHSPQKEPPVNPWELAAKYKEYEERQNAGRPQKEDTEKGQDAYPFVNRKAEGKIQERDMTGEREENPPVDRIFDNYPRIYPFEDNEITLCVKIEPKDIGILPSEAWVYSNNSFLLHGFYCYHHIILAKINDRFGCRYILGVPGIYHNRERFMAKMFGFECFKSIRKRELKQGDFGYWYVTIPM